MVYVNALLALLFIVLGGYVAIRYFTGKAPRIIRWVVTILILTITFSVGIGGLAREARRCYDLEFLKYEPLRVRSVGLATDGERWMIVENAKGEMCSFIVDSATRRVSFTGVLLPDSIRYSY
jgi:hypothetical protein